MFDRLHRNPTAEDLAYVINGVALFVLAQFKKENPGAALKLLYNTRGRIELRILPEEVAYLLERA